MSAPTRIELVATNRLSCDSRTRQICQRPHAWNSAGVTGTPRLPSPKSYGSTRSTISGRQWHAATPKPGMPVEAVTECVTSSFYAPRLPSACAGSTPSTSFDASRRLLLLLLLFTMSCYCEIVIFDNELLLQHRAISQSLATANRYIPQ